METIKITYWVILGLLVVIVILVPLNKQKSKNIKRLVLENQLRLILSEKNIPNFSDFSLSVLKSFQDQIDEFFLRSCQESHTKITDLFSSINKIKDSEINNYLKVLMVTAINQVETKRLATFMVANMSDYLCFIKNKNLSTSFDRIEEENNRYFKFISLILFRLNKSKRVELIEDIRELIEKYEVPDFTGNETMKKWFNEELPVLLKAELAKIKMYIEE